MPQNDPKWNFSISKSSVSTVRFVFPWIWFTKLAYVTTAPLVLERFFTTPFHHILKMWTLLTVSHISITVCSTHHFEQWMQKRNTILSLRFLWFLVIRVEQLNLLGQIRSSKCFPDDGSAPQLMKKHNHRRMCLSRGGCGWGAEFIKSRDTHLGSNKELLGRTG